MKKTEVCALIKQIGIVPAIRVSSAEDAHFAAESVTHGGVPIVEITMTVAGAIDLISHLVRYHPKMLVGAGTIMDTEMARKCFDAGASFLPSPGLDPPLIEFAAKNEIAGLGGGLDTHRGGYRVAGGIRLRQSVSLRASWRRQLHQSLESAFPPNSLDCCGGRESADRCQFHIGRCYRDWSRRRAYPDGGHRTAPSSANPGISATLCGIREGCACPNGSTKTKPRR